MAVPIRIEVDVQGALLRGDRDGIATSLKFSLAQCACEHQE